MPRQRLRQREDGRYCCRYRDKFFYGDTVREAQQKRDEYKRMIEEGIKNAANGLTVKAYAPRWLRTHKAAVSDKTYNDYAKQLNTLISCIGDIRMIDVTPDDIKEVFSEHYLNYSASTIKRARMLFIAMFDAAVDSGYARTNPCRSKNAQPHKGYAGTHRAITQEERQLIMDTDHRFRLGAMVMLYAGLRRGEALALTMDDIDFERKVIHVTRAIRYDSNKPIMADPKTEQGTRDVPLFPPLEEALQGHKGYIMTSASGEVCTETAYSRGWESYNKALSDAAGEEVVIRAHDLRHSFCTMLRDAGVEMKLAMQWMGHADEKMILRIYDHVTEERVQKNIKIVEKSCEVVKTVVNRHS